MRDIIVRNNILFVPAKGSGFSTISFFIAAGAKYETSGQKGTAHLLEHLLLASEDSCSQLYAETQLEQLVIQSTQTAEKTPTNLKKLYEHIFKKALDLQHFETQKQRVLIELQTEYSNDEHRAMYGKFFGNNSEQYKGWSGDKKSITRISLKNLSQFKEKYIRPERAICVVAGDFDMKTVENTLSELDIEHSPFENEELAGIIPNENILFSSQEHGHISTVEIAIRLSTLQDFKERVLNRLLRDYLFSSSGYFTKLLYKQLGATHSVSDNSLYWTNGGVLSLVLQIDSQYLKLFEQEFFNFFSSPQIYVNERDFICALEQTTLHYRQLFNDQERVTWWYSEDILLVGSILSEDEVFSILNKISFEEFLGHIANIYVHQTGNNP